MEIKRCPKGMSVKLTDEEKGNVFRSAASLPYYQIAVNFGFDKAYTRADSMRKKVYQICKEVESDPGKFNVHPDTVGLVRKAINARKDDVVGVGKSAQNTAMVEQRKQTIAEKKDIEKNKTISDLVLDNRNLAMRLLSKKMDRLDTSRKRLDAVAVGELAKVAGIMFDKGQIIQGQATENVAVLSKIDNNLSPEDAMNTLLKFREMTLTTKEKKDAN